VKNLTKVYKGEGYEVTALNDILASRFYISKRAIEIERKRVK
jgi:hypothetical protein